MTRFRHTAAVVPSVVGVGSTDLGMLSLGSFSRGKRVPKPYEVDWGEGVYLVGEAVELYARPVERMDLLRLADGADTRALTYAALAAVLEPGEHTLSLMVGFPVQLLADRDQAKRVLRELRGWLHGTHRFRVDGRAYAVRVEHIQAMAQPAGAFFAWGMDDEGRWARAVNDLKAPVAVMDIGFNTLDLFAVQNGRVVGQYTGGDTAGVRRATALLRQFVLQRYDVRLSHHQADALLRERHPMIHCAAGEVDLSDAVGQALEATARSIQAFVEEQWGRGSQFRVVLATGGGAALFRAYITAQMPTVTVLPDPVTANALGLARYGRRVFQAETVVGLDPGFGGFKAVLLSREEKAEDAAEEEVAKTPLEASQPVRPPQPAQPVPTGVPTVSESVPADVPTDPTGDPTGVPTAPTDVPTAQPVGTPQT